MTKPFAILLVVLFAACGTSVRYVAVPEPAAERVALRFRSLEVRDLVLPDYAEAPEILREGADGGLETIKGAIWGDGSAQAMTAALTTSLSLRTTASVAAEPWPLSDAADARLHVRVDRMVATASGTFAMSGQFALESVAGGELIQRFAVEAPLADDSPGAIAEAKGRAIDKLAEAILDRLRRR